MKIKSRKKAGRTPKKTCECGRICAPSDPNNRKVGRIHGIKACQWCIDAYHRTKSENYGMRKIE